MRFKNIFLIGTSHIAKQSLDQIKEIIITKKPGIVAVELDQRRLHALFSKEKHKVRLSDIKHIGLRGYLFALLGGWLQRKLGNIVGVAPGSEMKLAIQLAHESGARIALIDQDIELTLRKLSDQLTWREKWHFIVDLVQGVLFPKREITKYGLSEFDLTKVPSKKLIKQLIGHVKIRYPNIYDVLVHQRNVHMARNLLKISAQQPGTTILAVVGAGHEEDMIVLLKKFSRAMEVVNPADYRKGS
ncbi:TraB/GumN family protein [Candidatus Woesearchaeota archaeon]|nr:TraB/GumN family protein [Candidatus Woesearchaeota archaeon]